MTMDEYVRWLETRIAIIGTELEILINARKSLEMARGELDKPKPSKPPQIQKPSPKPIYEPQEGGNWQQSLDEVLRLIRVVPEHMTSGEVIARYYSGQNEPLTKREKDRIYAALSFLKSKGTIKRSQLGQWSLSEASAALTEEQTNG